MEAIRELHSFKLASHFTPGEIAACGSMRPDAIYTDTATGEIVEVEADSGQYTKSQIQDKVARCRAAGLDRQVWEQPVQVGAAKVPLLPGITVMRI